MRGSSDRAIHPSALRALPGSRGRCRDRAKWQGCRIGLSRQATSTIWAVQESPCSRRRSSRLAVALDEFVSVDVDGHRNLGDEGSRGSLRLMASQPARAQAVLRMVEQHALTASTSRRWPRRPGIPPTRRWRLSTSLRTAGSRSTTVAPSASCDVKRSVARTRCWSARSATLSPGRRSSSSPPPAGNSPAARSAEAGRRRLPPSCDR